MADPARRTYSLADYWAVEQSSPLRHEYLDGAIFAMAGASPRHNEVAANLLAALHVALRGTPCRPMGSDQRIRVSASEYTYPDVSVFCGTVGLADGVPPDSATNPVALFEVLSKGTREYDRGAKREMYQAIPSVEMIVLVDPEVPRIEVWRRTGGGFAREVVGPEGALRLLNAEIAVADVFARAIT